VRKLFEDNGIKVATIRMKHDGLKVFAFAETESRDMIEKAKNSMEGKEINGRKLRVRSSKDKSERLADAEKKRENNARKRSRSRERRSMSKERRAVGRDDIKKHLVTAFISFIDRDLEAAGDDAPEEFKGLMEAAKTALSTAYSLPDDDSYKVNKDIEDIFLGSVRRDIKLPKSIKIQKESGDEEKDDDTQVESKPDEETDDEGNWKRRKIAKDEDDDDIEKDQASEQEDIDDTNDKTNWAEVNEKLEAVEQELDIGKDEGEEDLGENAGSEADDNEDEEYVEEQAEESPSPDPTPAPTHGRGSGRGTRSNKK